MPALICSRGEDLVGHDDQDVSLRIVHDDPVRQDAAGHLVIGGEVVVYDRQFDAVTGEMGCDTQDAVTLRLLDLCTQSLGVRAGDHVDQRHATRDAVGDALLILRDLALIVPHLELVAHGLGGVGIPRFTSW